MVLVGGLLDYNKALEYYDLCLAIRFKILGEEHPEVAASFNNIGLVWANKGEYDKVARIP